MSDSDQLNKDEEDLLQSALQTAFQPAHLRRVSVTQPLAAAAPTQPQAEPLPATTESPEDRQENTEEEWKRDYDAHVSEWRARSAEQREKAEQERLRWESKRAAERARGEHVELLPTGPLGPGASAESVGSGTEKAGADVKEWESVNVSLGPGSTRVGSLSSSMSPSVVDARDLVTGEAQGRKIFGVTSIPQSTGSSPPETSTAGHDRNNGSGEKWEDVHRPSSMTSSFPSLSYPSDPHSPVSSQQHRDLPHHEHHHEHPHHAHDHHPHAVAPPATTTSAIFDSSLSGKTRALALFSSLAINLLLPFVNGVMLGFGEIFARNMAVKWFGWGDRSVARPGRVAANIGVNASSTQTGKTPWKSS